MGTPLPASPPTAQATANDSPESGRRKKKRSEMSRGEKSAATRRSKKLASNQPARPNKRRPKNWDMMDRGEKAAWTRKANARAAKRELKKQGSEKGSSKVKKHKSSKRRPKNWDSMSRGEKAAWTRKTNQKGRGKGRDKSGEREGRMSHAVALKKLERIRQEDPNLASAIEEEVEARANRVGVQGTRSKNAIVDGLANGYAPGPGDIVREGSIGGRILDGTIVVGSALMTVRLDEMIQARPLGLKPSTIKAIVEGLVLAVGLVKKNRKVTRYAALSIAGTASGLLVSMAARRTASAPTP